MLTMSELVGRFSNRRPCQYKYLTFLCELARWYIGAVIDIQENSEEICKIRMEHPTQTLILIKIDVSNRNGTETAYEEIKKNFGHIDVVLNIAGIFNDKDVQRTIEVNLGGVINSTLIAMEYMSKEHGGTGGLIANMSSVVGLDPLIILPVYCSTKAGIIAFTRALANDFYFEKTGVKFVTLCPGATITSMFINFTEKIIYPDLADESYRILNNLQKQSAADVSRCLIDALESSDENGAVWILENKKKHLIKLAKYWKNSEEDN